MQAAATWGERRICNYGADKNHTTPGTVRETGREGEMQLRCGQKLEGARRAAEEILGGCQDTKKDLEEMLAMLLEPDRTPASPREGFPERDGRVPRLRGLLPSALA